MKPSFILQTNFKKLEAFLIKQQYKKHVIICDSNTLLNCLPILISNVKTLQNAEIIEIEPSENSKQLETCAHIWDTLFELKIEKSDVIINLGGGVVTDLGGFIASVYKRGIPFINIPTTLLGMADASVGGKNGINYHHSKNSIGTITFPSLTFIQPLFLETLPQVEFQNGLAEVFKIALVKDKPFWNELIEQNKTTTSYLIRKSTSLKQSIVEKDPYEKKERKILNFGHSIGHAVEMLCYDQKQPIHHGFAVIIGMIIEAHISFQKKLLSKPELDEIILNLTQKFTFSLNTNLTYELLKEYLTQDKKNKAGLIKMALLNGIGKCVVDVTVSEKEIIKAINFFEGKK
jgi:3-dehydroquinate synthase